VQFNKEGIPERSTARPRYSLRMSLGFIGEEVLEALRTRNA
jgi:hypothetical protein